jgi:hypothetical protein
MMTMMNRLHQHFSRRASLPSLDTMIRELGEHIRGPDTLESEVFCQIPI